MKCHACGQILSADDRALQELTAHAQPVEAALAMERAVLRALDESQEALLTTIPPDELDSQGRVVTCLQCRVEAAAACADYL